MQQESELITTYKNLLHKLPDNTVLDKAYEGITDIVAKTSEYVKVCKYYDFLSFLTSSCKYTIRTSQRVSYTNWFFFRV